jgi:hypothetical protein
MAHTKHFHEALSGSVLKEVNCEKCDCWYRYRLVRRAEGIGSALFGIGDEAAQRRSHRRAKEVLKQRLATAVDPVACPMCGWYQQDMVREIHRRRYEGVARLGWTVAALVGVILASFLAAAAQEDWSAPGKAMPQRARVFLVFAALTTAASAAVPLVVVPLLKRASDPNAGYPNKPDPIPGAPRGFTAADPEFDRPPLPEETPPGPSGPRPLQYERLDPRAARGWITVQILHILHPPVCCSCLQPTESVFDFRPTGKVAEIPVRMCARCHRDYEDRCFNWTAAGVVSCGLAVAAFTYFAYTDGNFVLALAFAVIGAVFSAGFVNPAVAAVFRPVRFRGFSREMNTIRLKFRNPVYNTAFAEENR